MIRNLYDEDLKYYFLFPNIAFAVTFIAVVISEFIEHKGSMLTLAHVMGWELLPIIAIVSYNLVVAAGRARKSYRNGILVFTVLFFLCYLVDNGWIIAKLFSLISNGIKRL